jgi:outer membrane protein OmpA-like peptidoglycan-associated protein
VCFRTDDATLDGETVARLQKVAKLASAIADVKVKVDGYADPRGSDDYNMELSLKRAQAVADVLTGAGLGPERVIVDGHGAHESTSSEGDLDGYALERRVTIQLASTAAETVARNP